MNIPVYFVVEEGENFLEYPAESRSCVDGLQVVSLIGLAGLTGCWFVLTPW